MRVFSALYAQELPDGAGRNELEMICSECHGIDRISAKGPRTPGQWQQVIGQMTALGAKGSNAQMEMILKYLNNSLGRRPTQEEAAAEGLAGAPPDKEPPAELPLAQARDLSGTWMTSMWYNMLNMGPKGALPSRDIQLHGVKDPTAQVVTLLTPWAKEISDKYSMYTDPVLTCNSVGPQVYFAPYAFEIIPSPARINC